MTTSLFCIKEDERGIPVAGRMMGRKFASLGAAWEETERLMATGKWTRVQPVCGELMLQVQFAKWASSLLSVNPRYVLSPRAFVNYIRGVNWNHPCPDYAHYEERVKAIGDALWHEFSAYREVPFDEAVRRMTLLLGAIGLKPVEES